MLLALLALALIAAALAAPLLVREVRRLRLHVAARRRPTEDPLDFTLYDPGRERRAEQRARELLRSCVNDEEWDMYRDLGFLRVDGRHARREARMVKQYAEIPVDAERVIFFPRASGG